MKNLHLGLFGRFFVLFALTTISLVAFILLGIFAMSEDDAREYLTENQTVFEDILERIARDPLDAEKLTQDAKDNYVELLVVKDVEVWTTSSAFPNIEHVISNAENIGRLFFTKYDGKYYLTAQHDNNYTSVTSNIMNLIVYPNWLVLWPWFLVVLILLASYGMLKRLLNPINQAIQSAQHLSRGELDYQIDKHPKTELSALTRSLNLMARNLNKLFNAQNDLLLAISHELRSPLARMKVSLAMLENDDIAKGLNQDIEHMDDLIGQLLEGERLNQGHAVLDLTTYYLPKLIDDVLSEPGTVELARQVGSVPEIAINIDVGRMMFALRNLLRNAIEHSPSEQSPSGQSPSEQSPSEQSPSEQSPSEQSPSEQSPSEQSPSEQSPSEQSPSEQSVELSAIEQETALLIKVKDSGPGIPDELLDRIFEPFFRTESIENRSFNGVGLGLYLCKRIAEAHGGELTVCNNDDKGCTFTITLPLNPPLP